MTQPVRKFAYGALFVLVLPLLLVAWANRLDALLPDLLAPPNGAFAGGGALITTGVLLMAWSMASLWRRGGGLPMNAFPPPRLVESGPYRLVPHPIYVGFALTSFGVALAAGSSAGLWIVAPAASVGAFALAAGHETPDLRRRFGRTPRTLTGDAIAWLARPARPAWHALLAGAERVANSWREWRLGRIRLMNHGIYAGLAAAAGVAIMGALLGPEALTPIVVLALASLVGAGLWGQYWVGSRSLLRPFGYFGSVLAILLALPVLAWRYGVTTMWDLAAAAAVAAPWVQTIGRLRCLVQGCCHGAPLRTLQPSIASAATAPRSVGRGLTYRHPRSRVLWVSHLGGVPLHATPVYSMVGNVLVGALTAALWIAHAPAALITGAYLMGAGMARFVEESRRGEVTTPSLGGLRLYQWFAVASVLIGAGVTCLASPTAPVAREVTPAAFVAAFAVGVLHLVAMGVDFPESNRRFSRLGPV